MRLLAALIQFPFRLLRRILGALLAVLGSLPVRFAGIGLIVFAAAQAPTDPGMFYGGILGWSLFSYLAKRLAPSLRPKQRPRLRLPESQPAPPKTNIAARPSPPPAGHERPQAPLPGPSLVQIAVPAVMRGPTSEAAMAARLSPSLQQILRYSPEPLP